MESGPTPNAKPSAKPAATTRDGGGVKAGIQGASARRYPKPPGLLPRFLLLCLRPESWAQAARYPTYITLIPLALAILIGAIAMSIGDTTRTVQAIESFAKSYDARPYPALELSSDGILSSTGPLADPIRFELPAGGEIYIDPTGKTSPDSLKSDALFITSKEILLLSDQGPVMRWSLANFLRSPMSRMALPPPGQTKRIDSASINGFLNTHKGELIASAIPLAILLSFIDVLWAALMMFLLCPIVMLATAGPRLNPDAPDRRLILPRRAAYRMAAAFLVPLVLLNALLHATGHPVSGLLGGQGALLFWFFSSAALAVWTGFIARRMFAPQKPRRA